MALGKLIKTNYDEDLLRIYKGLFKCYNNKQEYKEALTYHVALLETEKKLLNKYHNLAWEKYNLNIDKFVEKQDFIRTKIFKN
jgi:hypothetical protein